MTNDINREQLIDATVQQMQDELEYRVRTAAVLAKAGCDINAEVRAGRERIGKLACDLGNPQGEPTDASVWAALDDWVGGDFRSLYTGNVPYWEPKMRAALRAAFQEGGKRG